MLIPVRICSEQSAEVAVCIGILRNRVSHSLRAVRHTRKNSSFCRQSSIRLHSTHTGIILPMKLWGKSPCEVSESVIRRLQNTSSWSGSEAECRVSAPCSHRRCGESPRVEFQRVSSERLQNTSSWTGNEAECRVSVCVGVLRNSTLERSLPIADRARFTVVKLRLPALGSVLTVIGDEETENSSCVELECGMTPLVRGVSARSHLMGSQLG